MEDIPENNDYDTFSFMKEALVSELAEEELRAERSLRVLQHQENRISQLENELCAKSTILQTLQESHTNLKEVHRYQEEVQELQKQLIKMQEIQYLTEVVQPELNEHDKDNPSNNSETCRQGPSNVEQYISSKHSGRALFKSFATDEGIRASSTNDVKHEKNATDNAIFLEDAKNRRTLCSLKSAMGSMGRLLPDSDRNVRCESSREDDIATNYFAENYHKSGECKKEDKFTMEISRTPIYLYDSSDDEVLSIPATDNISILKDALSSHKQSIEDLSTEIATLKKEKSELLSHLETLSEWKLKTENVLESSNKNSEEKAAFPSKEEINVIRSGRKSSRETRNDSNANFIPELRNIPSKQAKLKLKKGSTTNSLRNQGARRGEESDEFYNEASSKLEGRAKRFWETACRYFTPKQAHFILTAHTVSPGSDEESDQLEEMVED